MNQYLAIVQAPEGYPAERRPVEGAPTPPQPIVYSVLRVDEVTAYLDEAIVKWRETRDAGGDLSDVAPCYVDAFQSVRSSLIGKTLP